MIALLVMASPLLLLALYAIGIQYQRGGWWRVVLPVTLVTFVFDVVMNYTVLAIITWDRPAPGEYTFSKRLRRLIKRTDWRGTVAWRIKLILDYFDPDGAHI